MPTQQPRTAKRPNTLREEHKAFTRRRLIDAALQVFGETGYAAATIEDITSAAGTSRATFYLHFKSKADIVGQLLEQVLLPESDSIYEDLHSLPEPSWAEVREFVRSTLGYWDRHRVALDVLKQVHAVEREEIADFWSRALKGTSSVLAHYLTHLRGVDEEAARVRAVVLIALLDGADFYRHLPDVDLDEDLYLDTLADFWATAFGSNGAHRGDATPPSPTTRGARP